MPAHGVVAVADAPDPVRLNGAADCAHPHVRAAAVVARLGELRREAGRETLPFEVIVGGRVESRDDLARYGEAGAWGR